MTRDPRAFLVLPVAHPKGCRSYVVIDPPSREAAVVDPLLDRVSEVQRLLSEHGATLRWIVDTHSHADHLSGAAALAERTGAEIVMHPDAPSEIATVRPVDGASLPLGERALLVHHAPGNTPDGLVVEAPGAFFTGDVLLIGTVGLRDAPGADAEAWFATLGRLFRGRDETTVIHPGHDDMGRTQSTLKHERTGNAWLRADDMDAFRERYRADDRPPHPEAAERLEANRRGLTKLPRDLDAAAGFVDPAHATEAALRRAAPWAPPAPRPARASGVAEGVYLVAGGVVVSATLLGWLVHPLFHGLSAAAGIALVALALARPSGRRRRGDDPGLYYEGPAKKTLG